MTYRRGWRRRLLQRVTNRTLRGLTATPASPRVLLSTDHRGTVASTPVKRPTAGSLPSLRRWWRPNGKASEGGERLSASREYPGSAHDPGRVGEALRRPCETLTGNRNEGSLTDEPL